ncbi:MAG TPA: DUF4350 domain-containing protein [Chitinophagaceae bacterium]|nr:DUF4350 domain-containing protein [Chitinophagaceae bacterium]
MALFVVAAAITLFIIDKRLSKHRLDQRISFRRQDKIPYGMYVAYQDLKYIFPKAVISISRLQPGYWNSLSTDDSNQALLIITPQFFADEFEIKELLKFAESGNDVFISTRTVSSDAEKILGCRTSRISTSPALDSEGRLIDKLSVSLFTPPFADNSLYDYPGFKFNSWFYEKDTSITDQLGGDELHRVNFIHLGAGKGNFYIHLAPLAFSNYFLLHDRNIGYYENAFSLIRPDVTKVIWDEYFLNKGEDDYSNSKDRTNWLNVLFRFPSLKAALLTAIFTLLLFIFLEMRRKQRYIPVIEKPRNDSLDFVKTIGRLYYDKGDHKNLCRKMAAYFLEHIRNRYKLATGKLDEDFIRSLQIKTGCTEEEIRGIVGFIKYLDDAPVINDKELTEFHKQLESFYKIA